MDKVRRLIQNYPRLFPFLVSVLILLIFYQIRYGLAVFDPTYINWIIDDIELANGFFSFGYFRHQDWGLPLGKVESYFYPLGTNLYTADIPLFALFFKPFSPILPENFQYIGLCYLICHVLQAWFAILLCERLGIKGLTGILVVVFFLFAPVLMTRFIHPCLFCQWIILAGIWIYLIDPEKTPVQKILLYQLGIYLVSGLMFAYMWAMVFGFSVALFLRLWLFDKKIKFLPALGHFSMHTAIMVLLWLLIGLISPGGLPNYEDMGWGIFSVNLNALYNSMNTATLIPTFPFYGMQHLEGYAYLGAGILLLLVICIGVIAIRLFSKKNNEVQGSWWKIRNTNMLPLLLFLGFSTLYALTNMITLNGEILFQYKLSDTFSMITNSFRASGRMFWPVYYFIIVVVFYYFNQIRWNLIAKNAILLSCLAIQLYDLQYFLKPLSIKYGPYEPPISKAWEKLIQSFDPILFYPGFRRTYLTYEDYRYFAYYATRYQKRINVGYPARFDRAMAIALIKELGDKIRQEGPDENTLYVSFDPFLNTLVVPIFNSEVYCFRIDGYLALFKKTKATESLARLLEEKFESGRNDVVSRLFAKPWTEPIGSMVTTKAKSGLYGTDDSDMHFYLQGWTFLESSTDNFKDSVCLVLESTSKRRLISPVYRFGTPDVVDFFQKPGLAEAGFTVCLLKSNLKTGVYRTGLLYIDKKNNSKSLYWLNHLVKVTRTADPVPVKSLPQNRSELKFNFYDIKDTLERVFINCWAFPKSGICRSCKPYFTLTTSTQAYAVDATLVPRSDVVSFFNDSSLLNTGLELELRKSSLPRGAYKLGILFKDTVKQIDYFTETDKLIYSGMDDGRPEVLKETPKGHESVRAFVDKVDDKGNYFQINGWAFINDVSTDFTEARLVLQSKDNSFSIATTPTIRADLQSYFKLSYNVDLAGFSVKVKKSEVPPGDYRLCILMHNKKTNTTTLQCVEASVKM